MEAEGTWKRLEEVAEWKGEIDCIFLNPFGKQLFECTNTVLFHHTTKPKCSSIDTLQCSSAWVSC